MDTATNYDYAHLYPLKDIPGAMDEYGIHLVLFVFGKRDVNILLALSAVTTPGMEAREFGNYSTEKSCE